MFRGTRVSRPFTILVANLTGQYDANGNPIKQRTGFQEQLVNDLSNQMQMGLLTGPPAPATAEITVVDNDFTTGAANLYIGEYELVSGVHYTPGGTVALTAAALATAIDNLPGFSASDLGAVVSILGPYGPDGDSVTFNVVYDGTVANFTMLPTTEYMALGAPNVGPPRIL